jgi:putative membrane protein
MWWGHGMTWEGMIWGGLMMLLFWGGLIALAVILIRTFAKSGSERSWTGGESADTALEIIKKRYARGEISKSEYEEMRRDLQE